MAQVAATAAATIQAAIAGAATDEAITVVLVTQPDPEVVRDLQALLAGRTDATLWSTVQPTEPSPNTSQEFLQRRHRDLVRRAAQDLRELGNTIENRYANLTTKRYQGVARLVHDVHTMLANLNFGGMFDAAWDADNYEEPADG